MHLKSSVDGFLCRFVKTPFPIPGVTLGAFDILCSFNMPKGKPNSNIFGTFENNPFDLLENVEDAFAPMEEGNELVEVPGALPRRKKRGPLKPRARDFIVDMAEKGRLSPFVSCAGKIPEAKEYDVIDSKDGRREFSERV